MPNPPPLERYGRRVVERLMETAGDAELTHGIGPTTGDMALFAAYQNSERPSVVQAGLPEPYFGVLREGHPYSVNNRRIPESAAVIWLYYLYDHAPGPTRTPHHWLGVKVTRSSGTIEVLDPTLQLNGHDTPIQSITAAMRRSSTLAPLATGQVTWVGEHYHADIWQSGYGCLSWASEGGIGRHPSVSRGVPGESVTEACRQWWLLVGQTVAVDDESYAIFTSG